MYLRRLINYNKVVYKITKKGNDSVITLPITPTITEKIMKSKCGKNDMQ